MWDNRQWKCIPANFPLLSYSWRNLEMSWKSQGKLGESSFSKMWQPWSFESTRQMQSKNVILIEFKAFYKNIWTSHWNVPFSGMSTLQEWQHNVTAFGKLPNVLKFSFSIKFEENLQNLVPVSVRYSCGIGLT